MADLNGHEGGNAGDGQGAPKGPGEGDTPLAEGMEGRGWAKGNAGPQTRPGRRTGQACPVRGTA
jgi:hypothetical protein